jgi:hypothetical protein
MQNFIPKKANQTKQNVMREIINIFIQWNYLSPYEVQLSNVEGFGYMHGSNDHLKLNN